MTPFWQLTCAKKAHTQKKRNNASQQHCVIGVKQ